MSHSIAIPHQHRHHDEALARVRSLLVAAVLGVAIGALGFGIVATSVDFVRTALLENSAAAEAVVSHPPRELPREWRWERKAVEYDHMYRQKAVPRNDWIREERRR